MLKRYRSHTQTHTHNFVRTLKYGLIPQIKKEADLSDADSSAGFCLTSLSDRSRLVHRKKAKVEHNVVARVCLLSKYCMNHWTHSFKTTSFDVHPQWVSF